MKKKKQRSARTRFGELMGLSGNVQTVLQPRPLLHFDCAGALEVQNSKGVLCYNAQTIVLDMGTLCVRIEGDELRMDTYRKDFIRIRGRFFAIHICYERV